MAGKYAQNTNDMPKPTEADIEAAKAVFAKISDMENVPDNWFGSDADLLSQAIAQARIDGAKAERLACLQIVLCEKERAGSKDAYFRVGCIQTSINQRGTPS